MNFKLATYATMKRKLRGILGLIPVGCIALQLSFIGFILITHIPTAYSQSTSVLTGSLSGVSGNESISNYESVSSDTVSTTDLAATGTITADTISATSTIRAATFIFSASGIPLYVGDTSTSDSGKALIYDATANSVNLLPITDYLDFATVGSSLKFNDISDVSVEFASEGWVPAWNAASEIWEATPAVTTSGSTGITESEVVTLIESATNSLTFDEISNVSMAAKIDGVIPYWNAAESVWDATPQASGGTSTGGASTLSELTDVSLSSPTNGQFLGYNGSAWVNTTGGGGGGASPATIVIAAADSHDSTGADYICDGTADDVEINAAIAAIESATGGCIQLLDGTFFLSAMVDMNKGNIWLRGQGRATRVVRAFNTTDPMIRFSSGGGELYGHRISDMQLDGAKASYASGGDCVYIMPYVNNFTVDGLHVVNSPRDGISYTDNTVRNRYGNVTNCSVSGSARHGISLVNCGTTRVVNCAAYGGSIGFYIHLSKAITLDSCQSISNSSDGIHVASSFQSSVSNCISRDNTGIGINTYGGQVVIIGNTSHQNGNGILCEAGTRISVRDNYVSSNTGYGFKLYGGNDISLSGNYVYSNTTYGIYIDAVRAAIIGNRIMNNGSHGIYRYPSLSSTNYSTIQANQFYQNTGWDIYCVGWTAGYNTNMLIGGNYFYAPVAGCIKLEGAIDTTIHGNYFAADSAETYAPIYIDNSGAPVDSDRVKIGQNTVIGNFPGVVSLQQSTQAAFYQNQWGVNNGAASDVAILSSSASAKIGIATSEFSSIDHVITVAPDATTNPIATSWDTWSLPELKSGIASVSDDKKRSSVGNIGALKLIEYDWKYNEPEPVIAKEDIGTATETAILQGWEKRRAAWERQKNKVKSWSADITDPAFPAELGSYNADGKLTGINNTAVIWRLVGAVQELQAEVERLKFGGKN